MSWNPSELLATREGPGWLSKDTVLQWVLKERSSKTQGQPELRRRRDRKAKDLGAQVHITGGERAAGAVCESGGQQGPLTWSLGGDGDVVRLVLQSGAHWSPGLEAPGRKAGHLGHLGEGSGQKHTEQRSL